MRGAVPSAICRRCGVSSTSEPATGSKVCTRSAGGSSYISKGNCLNFSCRDRSQPVPSAYTLSVIRRSYIDVASASFCACFSATLKMSSRRERSGLATILLQRNSFTKERSQTTAKRRPVHQL
eukprot:4674075-Pleurochrysis_carterae.AAC.1